MKNPVLSTEPNNRSLLQTAFRTLLDNTADLIFIKDRDLRYVAASDPFVKMTGKEHPDQVIGHTDTEIFEDQTLARRYRTDDLKLFESGQDLTEYVEPLADESGYARYASTSKYILRNAQGDIIGILGISKDITTEYLARQHYHQELTYLFTLPADTYAAVFIDIDDWRIVSQRRQLVDDSTMQSCHTVDALLDFALASFVDPCSDAAGFYRKFSPPFLNRINNRGQTHLSFTYLRRMADGKIRWVNNEVHFLIDPETGHLCVMLSARDVDAQKREEHKILSAARLDQMTMLLNRETAISQIREILEAEPDSLHALFMLDIDNFKSLNDTLGHQAGDAFLITLAHKLQNNFRERDVVARLGGDEFIVFMHRIADPAAIDRKARRLLDVIRETCAPFTHIQLSCSIGISVADSVETTFEQLYSQADQALYQAKRNGKNRYHVARP